MNSNRVQYSKVEQLGETINQVEKQKNRRASERTSERGTSRSRVPRHSSHQSLVSALLLSTGRRNPSQRKRSRSYRIEDESSLTASNHWATMRPSQDGQIVEASADLWNRLPSNPLQWNASRPGRHSARFPVRLLSRLSLFQLSLGTVSISQSVQKRRFRVNEDCASLVDM